VLVSRTLLFLESVLRTLNI